MRMGFGYTAGPTLHGWAIRKITGGAYNHALIWFEGTAGELAPVPDGERVYFESSAFVEDLNGFTGPHKWDKMHDWLEKDTRNRVECLDLPYKDWVVDRAWGWCLEHSGKIKYAPVQLWHNLLMCLFGRGIGPTQISRDAWTCSEAAARLWAWIDPGLPGAPGPAARILGIGEVVVFDAVTPSGKYGLYEAHKRSILGG